MRFSESIRNIARRLADGHAEHACDQPGGTPLRKAVLRSIAAVLLGWLVTVGGYVVTMVVIALFNPEAFQPAVHHSVGYWLLTLSVGLTYSVIGGFVTGTIARRREIAHAIGLVVFGLLIWECLPGGACEHNVSAELVLGRRVRTDAFIYHSGRMVAREAKYPCQENTQKGDHRY